MGRKRGHGEGTGFMTRNVAKDTEPPKREKKEIQVLTVEKVEKLLAAAKEAGEVTYIAILLALSTGMGYFDAAVGKTTCCGGCIRCFPLLISKRNGPIWGSWRDLMRNFSGELSNAWNKGRRQRDVGCVNVMVNMNRN
ncbi:hypothetical protein [Thermosinus carboxydivorans]|nr:hypothetical protein [Thermosinus carboxydivorans]